MMGIGKCCVVVSSVALGMIGCVAPAVAAEQGGVTEVSCNDYPGAFKLYIDDYYMRTECYIGDGNLNLDQDYVTNVETGQTGGYYTWTPECLRTQEFWFSQAYNYGKPGITVCSVSLSTAVSPAE